jgi:hypothetical protein
MNELKEELRIIENIIKEKGLFITNDIVDGCTYGIILNNNTWLILEVNKSTIFPDINYDDIIFIKKDRYFYAGRDGQFISNNSDIGDYNVNGNDSDNFYEYLYDLYDDPIELKTE